MDDLSNSQIKRAGELLRRHRSGELKPDLRKLAGAHQVLDTFRARWTAPPRPLNTVAVGLRSMVRTLDLEAEVSQRLKRIDRIVQKLVRTKTRLTELQDIAGCRAVVEGREEQDRLVQRAVQVWHEDLAAKPRLNPRDYVTAPRETGYRAVHLIVVKHGLPVEVQIRTGLQHSWAMIVEGLEERTGEQLKDNEGSPTLLATLRELADTFALVDEGDVSSATIHRAQTLLSRLETA